MSITFLHTVEHDFKKFRIASAKIKVKKYCANYRPIPVVSHLGKVLIRKQDIVTKKLVDFLLTHRLLSSNQFVYVRGKLSNCFILSLNLCYIILTKVKLYLIPF